MNPVGYEILSNPVATRLNTNPVEPGWLLAAGCWLLAAGVAAAEAAGAPAATEPG